MIELKRKVALGVQRTGLPKHDIKAALGNAEGELLLQSKRIDPI